MSHCCLAGCLATLVALTVGTACPAAAKPLPRYGAFVYSHVCIEPESGDVAGHWIALTRDAGSDTLVYSWSEGAMMQPVVATQLKIDASGAITFRAHKMYEELSGDVVTFSGTITDAVLAGRFSDEQAPVRLSRVRNFSRRPAACR